MILLYRLFPCCKWKYCINPRADSVTCCAGAAHSNSSSPSFLQFSAKCFKIVEKMTALSLFYNRGEKRDFWSPSENSTSGSPCRFIMRRTFGSRCWGGGSGEETHGEVGCVGSARFKNHSTQKNPATLTPLANRRAALLKVHSNWKRRLWQPTNDGSDGVI